MPMRTIVGKAQQGSRLGRHFLAQFAVSRRGAVAWLFALGILPAIALGTGSLLVTRDFMNISAVQYATDTAAVALAKVKTTGAVTYVTPATASAWVQENTQFLHESLTIDAVTPLFAESEIDVTTQFQGKPRLLGTVGSLFAKNRNLSASARVQLFPSTLEVVFSIDNSAESLAGQQVASGMGKVLDKLFAGKDEDASIHVSVFAVGSHMNLGTKYADLISKESRRLPKPGSKYFGATKTQYEHQKEILEKINPSLVGDLLSPGGPGFDADAAVVARPDISSLGVDGYLEQLDHPPEAEEDKFRLLVSDNRIVKEGNEDTKRAMDYRLGFDPDGYRGLGGLWSASVAVDAKDFFCVPEDWWTMGNHAASRMKGYFSDDKSSWSGWRFTDLGPLGAGVIHFPMDGPLMPLLANSSKVSEITDRVKKSIAINTGCIDEHFTWAYRLLSPGWNQVWSEDGKYPAPYASGTQKHAWINVGVPTGGGYTNADDGYAEQPNILPKLLKKFADHNIVLHLILDDAPEATTADIQNAMDLYGKKLGWEIINLGDGRGLDLYDRISQNIRCPASLVRLVPTDQLIAPSQSRGS